MHVAPHRALSRRRSGRPYFRTRVTCLIGDHGDGSLSLSFALIPSTHAGNADQWCCHASGQEFAAGLVNHMFGKLYSVDRQAHLYAL